jgi:hypothetical protein
MFQFWRPGPYTEVRGKSPNAPGAVGENPDVPNQLFRVCGVLMLPLLLGQLCCIGQKIADVSADPALSDIQWITRYNADDS